MNYLATPTADPLENSAQLPPEEGDLNRARSACQSNLGMLLRVVSDGSAKFSRFTQPSFSTHARSPSLRGNFDGKNVLIQFSEGDSYVYVGNSSGTLTELTLDEFNNEVNPIIEQLLADSKVINIQTSHRGAVVEAIHDAA